MESALLTQKKVLIIDDEEELLEPLALGLGQLSDDFDYLTAADPLEGMMILDREPIDVLVADMLMPHVTGLDIIEQVLQRFAQTACVLMTAYGSRDIATVLGDFSVNYVEKPLDLEELHRAIVGSSEGRPPRSEREKILPPTFVRVLEAKKLTCRVEVECPEEGRRGSLFFHRGELFHAQLDGLRPREAACALLTCEKAKIAIRQFRRPFRKKIRRSLEELLQIPPETPDDDPLDLLGRVVPFEREAGEFSPTTNLIRLLSADLTLKHDLTRGRN